MENGAVFARSVRRKVEGKRWNERALKWSQERPGTRRSGGETTKPHTSFGGEIRSNRRLRGMLPRESATHTTKSVCAGEDGPVEARAQEGQPAPPAPNLMSTSTAAQTGGVDTDVMESEDIEPAVSSRAHATPAPIRPFVTEVDETMEQEEPERKKAACCGPFSCVFSCDPLSTIFL